LVVTLEDRLDPTVVQVADRPRETGPSREPGARRSEEHTLHAAGYDDAGPLHPSTVGGVPRHDRSTALLVVDLQNDFADPKGTLYVEGGQEIVPIVNEEIAAAQAAGATVIYTQDWHPEVTPHFEIDGGIWPVHCVGDTWGSEFLAGLEVGPTSEILRKGTDGKDGYSAFSVRDPRSGDVTATRLEALLRERGLQRLVIVGIATDYCVKESVLDARRLGFPATVLREGVRAVNRTAGDDELAFAAMAEVGAEIT
jgi:nicotinamidase/pyrazinamidase